jgi:hypothetical protein
MTTRHLALPATILLMLPAMAHALDVTPGQTVIVNTTTPSPAYTGQTWIDHKVSTVDLVVSYPGSPVTSYKQLTVQLVTNVYRNAGGTLAFAYNVSAADFAMPGSTILSATMPTLNLSNFGGFTTDVHAENMPNTAPSGVVNPKMLSVSRSADGDDLHYLFSTNATGQIHNDNTLFAPQIEATTPAVVFVQTDATDYIDFDATIETHSFDSLTPASFDTAFLTFASFSPTLSVNQTPPLSTPEPLSLVTLPLAIAALMLRRR